MKTNGPTNSTNSASTIASTMLTLLRNCTPFSTPLTADNTKSSVRIPMIVTSRPFETGTSQRKFKPLLIWAAPKPSEVAVPNSVAQIAKMSIALPIGPFTRSPISGWNAVLIRFGMPLRRLK